MTIVKYDGSLNELKRYFEFPFHSKLTYPIQIQFFQDGCHSFFGFDNSVKKFIKKYCPVLSSVDLKKYMKIFDKIVFSPSICDSDHEFSKGKICEWYYHERMKFHLR